MSKASRKPEKKKSASGFAGAGLKAGLKAALLAALFATPLCVSLPGTFPASSALASPYPGSGAPLIAERNVSPEGDPTNPFSYPFLVDIAKSMAKAGFPASFFLGLDAKVGPGIDLRTMLLYETGILKSPVRLFAPPRKKRDDFPSLSIGSIPESSGEMPSAPGPKLSPGEPVLNGSESSIKPSEGTAESPGLSLDFNKFKIDLSNAPLKNELTTKLSTDSSSIAMVMPPSADEHKRNEVTEFRFWTVPAPAARPKSIESRTSDFEGSFVMVSPGGLKAIEGRMFFLNKGQILLRSRGQAIQVETAVARINIESGATAFVEVEKQGNIRVSVLESRDNERGVGVKFNSDGKAEELRLGRSEELLVADHKLSDAEKSGRGKASTTGSGSNWSKGKFSAKALFESNSFFSTSESEQDPTQRQQMLSLKKNAR